MTLKTFKHPADVPAFPTVVYDAGIRDSYGGLTIREHFAGLAMQGLLADPSSSSATAWDLAHVAIEHADALIAELAKERT